MLFIIIQLRRARLKPVMPRQNFIASLIHNHQYGRHLIFVLIFSLFSLKQQQIIERNDTPSSQNKYLKSKYLPIYKGLSTTTVDEPALTNYCNLL
jgi:hypothetical protein